MEDDDPLPETPTESKDIRKEKMSASISPYLKRRAEKLVEAGEFTNLSDFTSTAISYFLGHYDHRMETEKKQKDENNRKKRQPNP